MTREADGGAGETDGGETEVYGVTENFTLKWSSQRIYMMDYERTMNQLFSGSRELFSGKRILLGDLRRRRAVRKEKRKRPVYGLCDQPGAVGL